MGVMPVPPAIMPSCVHLRSFSPPPWRQQRCGQQALHYEAVSAPRTCDANSLTANVPRPLYVNFPFGPSNASCAAASEPLEPRRGAQAGAHCVSQLELLHVLRHEPAGWKVCVHVLEVNLHHKLNKAQVVVRAAHRA